jgi:succinate dehydrogenase / fumarate reductase membrane anchor subunit
MDQSLMSQDRPRTGAASLSWIWQAATGVGLVVLAGLHMVAHHFVVEGGLRDFGQVQDYLAHPAIWPLEVLFLVVVTAHALLGVRAILFDLGLSDAAEKRVTQALWVIGVVTVAYGLWLTWAIINYPAG